MSRKEARLAREAANQLKQDEKTARFRERLTAPEVRAKSHNKSGVRVGADPESCYQMTMTWNADSPDCEGIWSWGVARQWSDDTWQQDILPKLEEWSRLQWWEIERMTTSSGHRMHHPMKVDDICSEAQNRLLEIEKVGDSIYRFRLGNLPRLWGYRIISEFQVLWYDPTHRIYPVD